MQSLFIDSCTERSAVALVKDSHCLYAAALPLGIHNSKYLLPIIQEGFASTKIQPKELDFITLGIGPGSYTGMRVGATIAKTLSYSCRIPLIGIPTLKGFIPQKPGSFAAVIDAKMGGAYGMKGQRLNSHCTYSTESYNIPLESFYKEFHDTAQIVGPSLVPLRKRIETLFPDAAWEWQETAPDPLIMTQLALDKYHKNEYSLEGEVALLYLKEP